MSGKTKIFVIHMKELIYTGIFLLLAAILIILLISMFAPKDSKQNQKVPKKQEALLTAPLVPETNFKYPVFSFLY